MIIDVSVGLLCITKPPPYRYAVLMEIAQAGFLYSHILCCERVAAVPQPSFINLSYPMAAFVVILPRGLWVTTLTPYYLLSLPGCPPGKGVN